MKKLYEVNALWYVIAESEEEAKKVKIELDSVDINPVLAEVINNGWEFSLPFGKQDNDEEKNCLELLSEQNDI
jgi:hypothetical protein